MGIIKGIHHISLMAMCEEDYKKTVGFYRDILGMPVVRQWATGIMLDSSNGLIEIFNNAFRRSND